MRSSTCVVGIAALWMALVGPGVGAPPEVVATPSTETVRLPPVAQPQTDIAGVDLLGSAAGVVVPEMIKLSADPRWELRLWAADYLGKLGPDAKAAVPALIELLKDSQPAIRQ